MKHKTTKTISPKTGSITVIECSANKIKICQSEIRHNRRVITHIAFQENIGEANLEYAQALAGLIKAHRLKINTAILSLDRSLVSIRLIKLPSADEKEIKEMALWQAAKLLPYKVDEIVVSHQTIKAGEDNFSYVLLIIIPKDSIKKFVDAFESVHIQPSAVTISSEGLCRWYIEQQAIAPLDRAVALVDIDASQFELVVAYQNACIFSRSFSLGHAAVQDRERIVQETKISMEAYYKQILQPIEKLVLVGDKGRISDLIALFSREIKLTPSIIDHLENIPFGTGLKAPMSTYNISLSSVCGLALSPQLPHIDLLPPELKERALYAVKKKQFMQTAGLAVCSAAVLLGIIGFNFYSKKEIIKQLDRQLAQSNPTATGVQEIKNKIAVINAQLNVDNSSLDILRELHAVTPREIYLSTFIFQDDKEVIIKGRAPSMSLVFNFAPILNNSQYFENVEVRYATQRKTQAGEVTDFEIACPLKGAKNAMTGSETKIDKR